MTSSPASETVEAALVEQPSLAASTVSTLTDPWSEGEDEDDDDSGVHHSLELVSASTELARDTEDDAEEEGFDLVNSRDLRSSSPISIVSMSSRDVVPAAPLPQPAAVTSSSSESEDLVQVLRQGEPAGITRMQPDTDTESWRSSSSASDCSASVGGRTTTTTTKSSISVSGSGSESESGRSLDGEDDHAAGAMRLSFPDPIAASLSGHDPAVHDQQINDIPRGLGADYSMLLDVTEAGPADSTDSQASSSSAASSAAVSAPASPMSETSRQLSDMSISPDKQAVSSPSSLSSGAKSSAQSVVDEMLSTSTSPLLMSTSTPPSPPPPHLRRKQQRQRRTSSPTPLSRSDTTSAKQSLLVDQPNGLDRDHEHEQQQQYGKSYDPAHVHDWIRSAAEASSPSSSSEPKSCGEEQEEVASETVSLEQASRPEDQVEQPFVDMDESMQQLEGGEAVRQQPLQPEHDVATSSAGPHSMTSSAATVVPGGGNSKFAVADEVLPGAMPESRGDTIGAQAQQEEEDDGDTASSSMQAYAHAPGTARSRKAVAVLSFVAAAVAIAASGWLDSTPTTSPAPIRTLPSSAPAPTMNCNAATTTTTTTTEEVMMTFSETIRALMMETMVAGSEAEAGGGATLITAMSIVRSDHNDDDDEDDDDQALSVAAESSCSCRAGSDQQPVAAIETRPGPAPLPAQVQEAEVPEPAAHPEEQTRSVFAPGTKLSELEELIVSRAQRRMHRHRQRRRGSLRRRRRELLSLFDRAAPPAVHAPNPPVMYVPPAVDAPKRRRQVAAPVEVAAADHSADSERGPESSWLSAWFRPSAADLVARVSTDALTSGLKRGRHALESANHGRRKLARHLERDVATVAQDLQRQRERVQDFTARHRATCKRSPHLPECFLERLGQRGQRNVCSWWDTIRNHVGGNRQSEVPRSWLDLIKRGHRKADTERVLDRAYARLARQLETLRLGTRRAQPLTYRGGQETINQARKAVQALKRVGEGFSAWRRGETSRDGRRRRRKNKTMDRPRRG